MTKQEIVQKLRELAKQAENEGIAVYLPTVLEEIASNYGGQAKWSKVDIDKVFSYMANMIEE